MPSNGCAGRTKQKEINSIEIPKTYYGEGCYKAIINELKNKNCDKILIIISLSIENMDIMKELLKILDENTISYDIYKKPSGEPTIGTIGKMMHNVCHKNKADAIIAIGGGSTIDLAKIVSVINRTVSPLQTLSNIIDTKKVITEISKTTLFVLPTTGSGSEATDISIVKNNSGEKVALIDPLLLPDIVLLDPLWTLTLPQSIIASTGLDALSHAIEAHISKKKTYMTKTFSSYSINLISSNLLQSITNPNKINNREKLMIGTFYAGIADKHAGVGLIHALSYPLQDLYEIPHSIAVSLFLKFVLEEYYGDFVDHIDEDILIRCIEVINRCMNFTGYRNYLIKLRNRLNLDRMVASCLKRERLLINNPWPISKSQIKNIYKKWSEVI